MPWTIGSSEPFDAVDYDLAGVCAAAQDTEDRFEEEQPPADEVEE